MLRFPVLLVVAALCVGCIGDESWNTKDISGLMPTLEFSLTSETGEQASENEYLGNVNLLFFGYTNCPDICPITLGRLKSIVGRLPPEVADRVRILFVSVDPGRDDPESLRSYTDSFGERFIGLTGNREQLDTLTKRYRTTYGYGEPDEQGNYLVSHGSAVYAFDAEGRARLLIRDQDDPQAVADDLERLVRG